MANEFGADAWDKYLTAIETSEPRIRALGVTEYYSYASYQKVIERKRLGRLKDIDLIFPNIEMRFGIGTGQNHPVNFHLLVSPEDPEHIAELDRFLRRLTFEAHGEKFGCYRDDLIRLGRKHLRNIEAPEGQALREGTNQFKVAFSNLVAEIKDSAWAQRNILIAVVAGENDGSSGLKDDMSLSTLRREIERSAHIIFGSSRKLRDFWLGLGAATPNDLEAGWGGKKPCLHGSDAHRLQEVGKPKNDLYSWVKGDVAFESLRQVVLEPATRAYVGPNHPLGAMPSEVIRAR